MFELIQMYEYILMAKIIFTCSNFAKTDFVNDICNHEFKLLSLTKVNMLNLTL